MSLRMFVLIMLTWVDKKALSFHSSSFLNSKLQQTTSTSTSTSSVEMMMNIQDMYTCTHHALTHPAFATSSFDVNTLFLDIHPPRPLSLSLSSSSSSSLSLGAHTYIHIYTRIHTYIHVYKDTHIDIYIHTYVHTYIRTYVHILIHT